MSYKDNKEKLKKALDAEAAKVNPASVKQMHKQVEVMQKKQTK